MWSVLPSLVERWFNPPSPGELSELRMLEHEPIGGFNPPRGHLVNKWSKSATRNNSGFEGPGSYPTTVGHNWSIAGSRGAAMRAYVTPALRDGWRLVSVSCSTTEGTSTIAFGKHPLDSGYGVQFVVKTWRYDHSLSAVLSVPNSETGYYKVPAAGLPAPAELLDTGVSRTDPGCLDSGAPAPKSGPRPNWSGTQVCDLTQKAWPQATNLEPQGEFCWLQVQGIALSIEAVSPNSRAYYSDQRLSPAGDDTRFALLGGGFWALRPGVAIVVTPRNCDPTSSADTCPTEAESLKLAEQLQLAP